MGRRSEKKTRRNHLNIYQEYMHRVYNIIHERLDYGLRLVPLNTLVMLLKIMKITPYPKKEETRVSIVK